MPTGIRSVAGSTVNETIVGGLTVTCPFEVSAPKVAVIVATPLATPRTRPWVPVALLTVARVASLLSQVEVSLTSLSVPSV